MTSRLSAEERELLKLIQRLPVAPEKKSQWAENVNENGLTEGLAEELRKALLVAEGEKDNPLLRRRYTSQLLQIVQRWRLSRQTNKR